MANLLSADTVADFFLLQNDLAAGDTISNLKLQKLVYYVQAWSLATRGKPMISDEIQAWAHGPVVPDLYHRFKKYGWGAIDPCDTRTQPYDDVHQTDLALMDDVWEKYGSFSAKQLERLTHDEEPWRITYGTRRPGSRCTDVISHKLMRDFYGKQLKQAA